MQAYLSKGYKAPKVMMVEYEKFAKKPQTQLGAKAIPSLTLEELRMSATAYNTFFEPMLEDSARFQASMRM